MPAKLYAERLHSPYEESLLLVSSSGVNATIGVEGLSFETSLAVAPVWEKTTTALA